MFDRAYPPQQPVIQARREPQSHPWRNFVSVGTAGVGSSLVDLRLRWHAMSAEEQGQYAQLTAEQLEFVLTHRRAPRVAPPKPHPMPPTQSPFGVGDRNFPIREELVDTLKFKVSELAQEWQAFTQDPVGPTARMQAATAEPGCCRTYGRGDICFRIVQQYNALPVKSFLRQPHRLHVTSGIRKVCWQLTCRLPNVCRIVVIQGVPEHVYPIWFLGIH